MDPDPLTDGITPTPSVTPPLDARRRAWAALRQLAPDIARIEPRHVSEKPPPRALPDGLFLQLLACFADTKKRQILRALLFDLLADDLQKLIENPYEDE